MNQPPSLPQQPLQEVKEQAKQLVAKVPWRMILIGVIAACVAVAIFAIIRSGKLSDLVSSRESAGKAAVDAGTATYNQDAAKDVKDVKEATQKILDSVQHGGNTVTIYKDKVIVIDKSAREVGPNVADQNKAVDDFVARNSGR